jgi:hypothetical protein
MAGGVGQAEEPDALSQDGDRDPAVVLSGFAVGQDDQRQTGAHCCSSSEDAASQTATSSSLGGVVPGAV